MLKINNDLKNGIHEATEYLELFLRNLLLDEKNKFHNRSMHISGMLKEADIESAKADIESAKVDIENAEANIEDQKVDKEKENIYFGNIIYPVTIFTKGDSR